MLFFCNDVSELMGMNPSDIPALVRHFVFDVFSSVGHATLIGSPKQIQ
jgi:hypothetical protein